MAIFTGTIGNDTQDGTSAADAMDYSQGGEDVVNGLGGNDTIQAGAGLDALDRFDGGDGDHDTLVLSGDYSAGLTLQADTIRNFEVLSVNATGGGAHIRLAEGNIAAGVQMQIDCTDVGIIIDASALVTGSVDFNVGNGNPQLIGTANDDVFNVFGFGTTGRLATFDGGPGGADHIGFLGAVAFHAANHTFQGIDSIYSQNAADLVLADGNVAAGATLDFGDNVLEGTKISVNAHKETDGHLSMHGDVTADDRFIGGHLSDTLTGGDGDDSLQGGAGGDSLTGGLGADTFLFRASADSLRTDMDTITDLESGDKIDLTRFDASTIEGGQQHFTQVAALDGHAGEVALIYKAGQDTTFLVADVDGDGRGDFWVSLGAGDHSDFAGLVL